MKQRAKIKMTKQKATMKKCKHNTTAGVVGAKMQFCLDCKTKVPNKDYEEELKELENARLHPKSTRNHIAIARRRVADILRNPKNFKPYKSLP